jgi:hypothetical protein
MGNVLDSVGNLSRAGNRNDRDEDSESSGSGRTEIALSSPESNKALPGFYRGKGRMQGNGGIGLQTNPSDDGEDHGRLSGASNTPYQRGAFRHSKTWVSADSKAMQDFVIVRNAMRRLFKHSEVSKWRYSDYIAHREAMVASEKARLGRLLKAKEEEQQRQLANPTESYTRSLGQSVTEGLNLYGNVSLVLGEKTIWCVDWQKTIWCVDWQNGKDGIAPWPSFAEMRWEGDDRAKTNVGRFLPLPREMGAPGITWSQLRSSSSIPLTRLLAFPPWKISTSRWTKSMTTSNPISSPKISKTPWTLFLRHEAPLRPPSPTNARYTMCSTRLIGNAYKT